jgi:hypothetical protein
MCLKTKAEENWMTGYIYIYIYIRIHFGSRSDVARCSVQVDASLLQASALGLHVFGVNY